MADNPTEFTMDDLNAYQAEREKYNQPIQAGLEGAARSATFGLSDLALAELGGESVKEGLAKRKEYNPIAEGIGQAAGVVGSAFLPGVNLVKGAGTLGRLAEGAAAKVLIDSAAQSTAKKILATAATKGIGSAIEGSFYGAGQVLSEAALGDPQVAAEHALSTIGLSTLLSGGLGAGLNVAGTAVKAAANSAKPLLKQARQQLVGVAPDIEHTILNKADDLQQLLGQSDNVEEAVLNRFQEKAIVANEARYQTIEDVKNNVENLIQVNSLQGKHRNIKPLFEAIDKARSKIAPSGKIVSQEIEKEIAQINDIENRLVNYVLDNADIKLPDRKFGLTLRDLEAAGISDDALNLNPYQLNDLKSQYFKSTDFAKQLGKVSETEKLYESLGALANKELDSVSPLIRKENARISNAIKSQEALKSYGLYDRGSFDVEKMRKIASIKDSAKWAEVKKHLSVLDDTWGTDLLETAELTRAAKQIAPKDMLSSFQTGRSLLGPAVGGAVGSVVGGPVAAGLGVLGSVALGSPAGIAAKIRAANAVENVLSSRQVNALSRLGGKAGALISDDLVPFVSAQVSALATIERSQKKVDREIDSAIKGIQGKEVTSGAPTNISVLPSIRFAPGSSETDRQRAFEKRLEEITKIVTNPDYLSNLMEQNMKGLSMIAPNISNALAMQATNAAMFLYSKAPKKPEMNALGLKQEWKVPDSQLASWERYVDAVENPMNVLKDLKQRRLTSEGVEALRAIYPTVYSKLTQKISEKFYDKSLNYQDRLQLSRLFGMPVENAMKPQSFVKLQSNFAQAEVQATPARSDNIQFSKSRQTKSQRIEAR